MIKEATNNADYSSMAKVRIEAAIALKVPMSGIPELDAMIRESRRLDMATEALNGALANESTGGMRLDLLANNCFYAANALLAASEKEQMK